MKKMLLLRWQVLCVTVAAVASAYETMPDTAAAIRLVVKPEDIVRPQVQRKREAWGEEEDVASRKKEVMAEDAYSQLLFPSKLLYEAAAAVIPKGKTIQVIWL
jgi:hypothetical protein